MFCITINSFSEISDNSFSNELISYYQNSTLSVSGLILGEKWSVSNMFGVLVYEGIALNENEEVYFPVKSGVYIIRSNNRTIKVMIKN